MHTRLKQFLAAENITQAQFADKIKIGKANVSHVLSGRNKPGYDFITAIMAGFPHLNINWLFFGTGKMYNSQQTSARNVPGEPASDLLFADFYDEPLIETAYSLPTEDEKENTEPSNSNKRIDNTPQPSIKQRIVSKIIILYDDGTYQEL